MSKKKASHEEEFKPAKSSKVNYDEVFDKYAEPSGEAVAFFTVAPGDASVSMIMANSYWPMIQGLMQEYGLKFNIDSIPVLHQNVSRDFQPKTKFGLFAKDQLLNAINVLFAQLRSADVEFTENFAEPAQAE